MADKKLGKMLKAYREKKGMTQVQLAKRAKVTQAYVAMLEAGVKKNPSLATLRRIAKALKVDVGELLA